MQPFRQERNPTGDYQRLDLAPTPSSPSIADDIGQPISPPPEPPADRLERFDRRTMRVVTASGSLTLACAGLLGAGIGEDEMAFLIPGALGVGVSLFVTALALKYGRETNAICRIGDNRATALAGLVVSIAFGIFTGFVGAADSAGS